MTYNISDNDMYDLHDLITKINKNAMVLEEDVRNLNNLIHVIKGDGVRHKEYRRD